MALNRAQFLWFWLEATARHGGGDATRVAVAIYNTQTGELASVQIAGPERAIRRGDAHETIRDFWPYVTSPPKTLAEMEKTIASTGNAMSCVSWYGGLPSMVSDIGTVAPIDEG